jgi:hypothetical protein
MLTEIYIEALLVDEELADQTWDAWDAKRISDLTSTLMWLAWRYGLRERSVRPSIPQSL